MSDQRPVSDSLQTFPSIKLVLSAMQMLADGHDLSAPVLLIDPKGGESVETTVGSLLSAGEPR